MEGISTIGLRSDEHSQKAAQASACRRFLPQLLCAFPMSFLMANIGIVISYSTIAVQEFLYPKNNTLPQLSIFKDFTMNKGETTVFVSLEYLCQPIGSILGGVLIGKIGRKKMVMLFNLPIFIGWLLIFFSRSVTWMYVASVFLGVGLGCGESPVATYIPETAEAGNRGVLFCMTQMFISLSFLAPHLVFLVVPSWRWSALVLSLAPLVTLASTIPIPDSPHWLMSIGKQKQAVKSLRILRGWVSKEAVEEELKAISQMCLENQKCVSTMTLDAKSTERLTGIRESWNEKIRYALGPRIVRPFIIIFTMFVLMYVSGFCWMRPYLGPVIMELLPDKDPEHFAMMVTVSGLFGGVASMVVIRYMGKRWLYLSSLAISGLSCSILFFVSKGMLSKLIGEYSFHLLSFLSGFGIIPLPWMMQGDLYPFRARGMASGIGAAVSYLIGFLCTSTFLSMLASLGMAQVFLLCFGLNCAGAVFLYFTMPETEGKSLEEIEMYFEGLQKNK